MIGTTIAAWLDVRTKSFRTFAAIAGIFLNDVDTEWAGNLTVWPGTHRRFEEYFRKHEPDPRLERGIPPVELPDPVQLKVEAGDLVFAHYQLAHAPAPNFSGSVRYAVYFRFHHDHPLRESPEVLRDIWRFWDGM